MQAFLMAALGVLLLTADGTPAPKHRSRQKPFQPVVRADVTEYTGHYVGIDGTHIVDVRGRTDGTLVVVVHKGEDTYPLRKPHLDGAILGGTIKDHDNIEQKFEAVFGVRSINGHREFGLLVNESVKVDQDMTVDRLFLKLVDPQAPAPPAR